MYTNVQMHTNTPLNGITNFLYCHVHIHLLTHTHANMYNAHTECVSVTNDNVIMENAFAQKAKCTKQEHQINFRRDEHDV